MRLGEFILSLLGKWCWRLLVDKEGLWYQVLKARYGEVGGWIQDGGRHASGWWLMMCNIREGVGSGVGSWFEDNTWWVIGNGRNTFFWTDNWVGGVPVQMKLCRLYMIWSCIKSVRWRRWRRWGGRKEGMRGGAGDVFWRGRTKV